MNSMYSKKITYMDYNGLERTEEFYFNLNEVELIDMKLESDIGSGKNFSELVDDITKSKSKADVIAIVQKLIKMSYGIKSADGRCFIKNEDVLNDFMQTNAYPKLFMELATDDQAAANFINGIIGGINV